MDWMDEEPGKFPPTEFEFLAPTICDLHGGVLVLEKDNNKYVVRETSDCIEHVTIFHDTVSHERVGRPVYWQLIENTSLISRGFLPCKKAKLGRRGFVESVDSLYLQTSMRYASQGINRRGETELTRPSFLTLTSDSVMVTETIDKTNRVIFPRPTARIYVDLKNRPAADSMCLFKSMWQEEVLRAVHTGNDTAHSAPFAAEFELERKFVMVKAHTRDLSVALLFAKKHSEERFEQLLAQYEKYMLTLVAPGAASSAPCSPLTGSQMLSAFVKAPAETTDTSDKTWDDLDDLFELPDVSDFPDAH